MSNNEFPFSLTISKDLIKDSINGKKVLDILDKEEPRIKLYIEKSCIKYNEIMNVVKNSFEQKTALKYKICKYEDTGDGDIIKEVYLHVPELVIKELESKGYKPKIIESKILSNYYFSYYIITLFLVCDFSE